MKPPSLRRLLAATACAGVLGSAHAQGIPVIDISAIVNLVMQYNQLMQQYQTLQSQLTTASNTLSSMTGARGMGGLFSNPAVLSSLPPSWQSVYGSIQGSATYASERAKLPTDPNPKVNAIYDSQAASNATLTDFFGKANLRLQQIAQLQGQIDSASDPAAKQDLLNRFATEQSSIQATTQLLAIVQQKQAQDIADARAAAQKDYLCKEFKNCL
jgi:type IV secretion system protein VirB5